MAFAVTERLAIACDGAATRFAVLARNPRTASRPGGTAARELIGADAICCWLTRTTARPTGCALTNVRCGTAVTALLTVRFTYVTLLMVVFLLMMVVL